MNEEELTQDMQFLNSIISQICNYAVDNELQPTETIKTIAGNLLALCEIANFDDWHKEDGEE